MPGAADFAKLVPGFDFLQGLMKNAGSAIPGMGQWIAPTLDPAELEKRIEELRTVQFWLEQNARMLGATIQALEVQRMTLSTLKTMNVPVADITEAFKIKMPAGAGSMATAADEPEAEAADEAQPEPAPPPQSSARKRPAKPLAQSVPDRPAAAATPPGVVDPMQWWGALTQQFTQLAANAMRDGAADATKNLATDLAGAAMRGSVKAAGQAVKKAVAPARKRSR